MQQKGGDIFGVESKRTFLAAMFNEARSSKNNADDDDDATVVAVAAAAAACFVFLHGAKNDFKIALQVAEKELKTISMPHRRGPILYNFVSSEFHLAKFWRGTI